MICPLAPRTESCDAPIGGWQPLAAWRGSGAASFTIFVKGAIFDFSG